jgi:transcriptional regulator with XRE-family HTH domain
MKDRIVKLLEFTKITPAEFADLIGIQRSSLSHVMTGRNYPGYVFIQKILEAYPQLNSRWLLTGQGKMFEEENAVSMIPTHKVSSGVQGDLFSMATRPNAMEAQPEKTVEETLIREEPTVPYASKKTENKVEKNTIFSQSESILTEKEVTKVLIFYRDRTFEEYKPA